MLNSKNYLAELEMISDLFGFELQNQAPSAVQAKVGDGEPVPPVNPEPSELFGFELQNQTPSSVQAKVGDGEPVPPVSPEPLAPNVA